MLKQLRDPIELRLGACNDAGLIATFLPGLELGDEGRECSGSATFLAGCGDRTRQLRVILCSHRSRALVSPFQDIEWQLLSRTALGQAKQGHGPVCRQALRELSLAIRPSFEAEVRAAIDGCGTIAQRRFGRA